MHISNNVEQNCPFCRLSLLVHSLDTGSWKQPIYVKQSAY